MVELFTHLFLFFPDAKCLVPMKHSVAVSMLNKTDHSITLKIPTLDKDDSCRFISTPIYRYAVYYGSVSNNSTSRCAIDLSDCWKIVSQSLSCDTFFLKVRLFEDNE